MITITGNFNVDIVVVIHSSAVGGWVEHSGGDGKVAAATADTTWEISAEGIWAVVVVATGDQISLIN